MHLADSPRQSYTNFTQAWLTDKDCPLNKTKRDDEKTKFKADAPVDRGLPSVAKARGKKAQPIPWIKAYEAEEHEEAAINARA